MPIHDPTPDPNAMFTPEQQTEYASLMHAMQTGVAYWGNVDPKHLAPKHARVGINAAMNENAALLAVLVDKGILTYREYGLKLLEFLRREVADYEAKLSEAHGGVNIKLG